MKLFGCTLAFASLPILAEGAEPLGFNPTNVTAMGLVGFTLYVVFLKLIPARDLMLAEQRKEHNALIASTIDAFMRQLTEQRNVTAQQVDKAIDRFAIEQAEDRKIRHEQATAMNALVMRLEGKTAA